MNKRSHNKVVDSDNSRFDTSTDWERLGKPVKRIQKGDILQGANSQASKGYYVRKGLLRSYTIDDQGKEHIFMFAPEGWVVSDLESYAMSAPSDLFIDALEDSEVIELKMDFKGDLIREVGHHEGLQKLLRRIAILQRRVIMLMSASAQQRYEHFMETYSQLLNRVPQKMIASYIGVMPQTLSTIRSKMAKGE